MSKPRIRPKTKGFFAGRFECEGVMPSFGIVGWGYGRTIQEAYENWLKEPIPF